MLCRAHCDRVYLALLLMWFTYWTLSLVCDTEFGEAVIIIKIKHSI